MTINLDNNKITDKSPLCSDIRVLKTVNDNLYFFAYNPVVLQFLCIWNELNTNLNFQHKTLEYAFNISISINKLRCYWLGKEYLEGPILKLHELSLTYPNEKTKKLTKQLAQCGLKPAKRDDGEPRKTHHYGSKNGTSYHNKYGHLFLEF